MVEMTYFQRKSEMIKIIDMMILEERYTLDEICLAVIKHCYMDTLATNKYLDLLVKTGNIESKKGIIKPLKNKDQQEKIIEKEEVENHES